MHKINIGVTIYIIIPYYGIKAFKMCCTYLFKEQPKIFRSETEVFLYAVGFGNQAAVFPLYKVYIVKSVVFIGRVDDIMENRYFFRCVKWVGKIKQCNIVRACPITAASCGIVILGAVMEIGHYKGFTDEICIADRSLRNIMKGFPV